MIPPFSHPTTHEHKKTIITTFEMELGIPYRKDFLWGTCCLDPLSFEGSMHVKQRNGPFSCTCALIVRADAGYDILSDDCWKSGGGIHNPA